MKLGILQEGEHIIRTGYSRFFLDNESMGGMLYLTNQRLCFRPHPRNAATVLVADILLHDIVTVTLLNKYGIFSQGIQLTLRSGRGTVSFAVWRRCAWQKNINTAYSKLSPL